jgi:hypothetical protein
MDAVARLPLGVGMRQLRRLAIFSFMTCGAIIACGGSDDSQATDGDAGQSGPDAQAVDGSTSDASSDAAGSDARADGGAGDSGILCTDGGTACGTTCVDTTNDNDNCGACDYRCFTGQTCGGSTCSGSEPTTLVRPVAPLSGMMMTTRRPTFKWALPTGFDGAHVQICSDRACATVVANIIGTTSAQPAADLPPGPLFWRLFARSGTHEAVAPSITWEVFIPKVSAPHESSPKLSPDLNGDGLGDIAMINGADQNMGLDDAGDPITEIGSDYVFLGRSPAPSSMASAILLPPENSGNNQLGYTASFAGDVDGDGFADLTTNAYDPAADPQNAWQLFFGSISGPHSTTTLTIGDSRIHTGGADQGMSSWGIGDVDGDGFDDLGGIDQTSSSQSALTVLLGGKIVDGDAGAGAGTFNSNGANNGLYLAASLGDLNGDGYGDFAVSAYGEGVVFVFVGSAAGFTPGTYTMLSGTGATNSNFGSSFDSGDVDGDGYPDLVIGAYGEAQGNIYVFRGTSGGISASPSWVLHGENDAGAQRTALGQAIAVGDFDGDGFDDIATGAKNGTGGGANVNEVVVYRGSSTGPSNVPTITLPDADTDGSTGLGGSNFGGELTCPLDANGDGISDLVVGAYGADPGLGFLFAGASPNGLTATPSSSLNGSPPYFTYVAN